MRKLHKGLTLLELLISMAFVSTMVLALAGGTIFASKQINIIMQRHNALAQMDYAFENIRLHCISASNIDSSSIFDASIVGETSKTSFSFSGENDIYTVTPDDLTDNSNYTYKIDASALILEKGTEKESLIDARYKPEIQFIYKQGFEPNFITVTITLEIYGQKISKSEGLRFWFVDAAE